MRAFLIGILFALLLACQPTSPTLKYQIVYKNNKEGKTLMGSRQALINAIRGGASLKIGWGVQGKQHTIEHISEPIWIDKLVQNFEF